MPRMIDYILRDGLSPDSEYGKDMARFVVAKTQNEFPAVFTCDDVYSLMMERENSGSDALRLWPHELWGVTPPFDFFWIEFRITQAIRRTTEKAPPFREMGALAIVVDHDSIPDELYAESSKLQPDFEPARAIQLLLLARHHEAGIVPLGSCILFIDAEGFASKAHGIRWASARFNCEAPRLSSFTPFFTALAMIELKGDVVQEERVPPESAQATWEGPRRLVKYKHLNIGVVRELVRYERSNNSRDTALHIVRGNVAYYGIAGRKLHVSGFKGRMLRRAHIRGNPARGIVEKDYAVTL